MGFEIPIEIKRELRRYAAQEHISERQAAVRILKSIDAESSRLPAIGEDLHQNLREIDPSLNLLSDLSEADLDNLEAEILASRSEGIRGLD